MSTCFSVRRIGRNLKGMGKNRDQADLIEALRTDVLAAAQRLIGSEIHFGDMVARIVETEAYRGLDDPGCHAYGREKMKNMGLYGPPGRAYVYFCYGTNWMLNVVSLPEPEAAAVLIRAAIPVSGVETMRLKRPRAARDRDLLSGPGKLCQAFGITGELNGHDLMDEKTALRILAGPPVAQLLQGVRIGLAPGKGESLPWRFADAEATEWVSVRRGLTPR